MKHIIFLLLLCFLSCEKKQEKKEKPPAQVEVAKASQEMMPYFLETIGNTEAFSTVHIRPQVNGEVTGYYFKDGAFVSKGDLLYTIDARPFEAEVEESEGELQRAKASLVFNTERAERYKGLLPEDYVSVLNYIQYASDEEMAKGEVTQYDGSLKRAEINLGYCTIFSPINGRCGKHLVDPGNIVSPDQEQALVVINQIQPLYATFTLAERFFPELQKYSQEAGLPVEISVVGDEEKTIHGWLDFVNNTVNKRTGTIKLRAIFDNENELLWPGQFVTVKIHLYEIPNAIVVPESAVQIDTKGPYVFIAKEDHTVELRYVKLGKLIGQKRIINEGIKSGETVVTLGQLMLSPGAKYQIKES